jgi:hypothetical protein
MVLGRVGEQGLSGDLGDRDGGVEGLSEVFGGGGLTAGFAADVAAQRGRMIPDTVRVI